MRKVQWVIDNCLLEKHDEGFGYPRIEEAVKILGHECFITKYIPLSDKVEFDFNLLDCKLPVVIYGSIQFSQQIERSGILRKNGIIPGLYFKKDALKFSACAAHYGELMMNEKFIMLPYGELKRRIMCDMEGRQPPYFNSKELFIRPDVVTKSFAGRIFDFGSLQDNIYELDRYQKIDDCEICVIAEPCTIIGEYRHVICNKEIIGQSQYRYDNELDIRTDIDIDCQRLVKEIIHEDYEIDNVYVVDTAMTLDGPRIVEFNAFSCSGLYASNTVNIVKRVSEAACEEFYGEIL